RPRSRASQKITWRKAHEADPCCPGVGGGGGTFRRVVHAPERLGPGLGRTARDRWVERLRRKGKRRLRRLGRQRQRRLRLGRQGQRRVRRLRRQRQRRLGL